MRFPSCRVMDGRTTNYLGMRTVQVVQGKQGKETWSCKAWEPESQGQKSSAGHPGLSLEDTCKGIKTAEMGEVNG